MIFGVSYEFDEFIFEMFIILLNVLV